MEFIIIREDLLKPVQKISSFLWYKRPIIPVLNNILLKVDNNKLLLTSTNLEIEVIVKINLCFPFRNGEITIQARKLYDICRRLPKKSKIKFSLKEEHMLISSDKSRYSISTLPSLCFPNLDNFSVKLELNLSKFILKELITSTKFAMAKQDIRNYFNGMLFEIINTKIYTVATDGHRLAMCTMQISQMFSKYYSLIIPRKSVIELLRLLDDSTDEIKLQFSNNNIRAYLGDYIFTSKLINSKFPNYYSVIPKNPDKIFIINCKLFKDALSRVSVLSNEKFYGVKLYINFNKLKISISNQNQETAEEILDILYAGNEIEISFNVNYLIDILNQIKNEEVKISLTSNTSSVQIEDNANNNIIYIIMPMRL